MRIRSLIIWMMAVIPAIASCLEPVATNSASIKIQDQGSFAVGGTVISNPGTFDADKRDAQDQEALNQYFRQMTPNVGPIDINVNVDAASALFEKIGPGILKCWTELCEFL